MKIRFLYFDYEDIEDKDGGEYIYLLNHPI